MTGRTFEVVADGGHYFEGTRWHSGRWYASDALRGRVYTFEESTTVEELLYLESLCSGLGWLPDDSLLVVSMRDRRLVRRTPGGTVSIHADLAAVSPHWINDMIVDRRGRAWVGTIGFAIADGADPAPGELFRVDPDGTVTTVADNLWCPNGVVITSDERTLVVAESFAGRLTAFTIAEDGSLVDRRVFAQFGPTPEPGGAQDMLADLEVAPDGLAITADDQVWVADAAHQRCVRVAPTGDVLDEIAHPDGANVYTCAVGGPDGNRLLIAGAAGFFEAVDGVAGTATLLATTI